MQKFIPILFVLLLLIPVQGISAQQLNIAEKAKQDSISISITKEGDIHVKHIVEKSSSPRQIDLIPGTRSNILVTDVNGEEIQHAMISGDLGVMFFPTREDRIVEYDLDDVLVLKDGLWKWDFLYLETTEFYFPDNIDMIFVTNKPVMLDDKKAINCHGCQMTLEFFEDTNIQSERVSWEDQEFIVEFITLTEIESFRFDQPAKSMSFNVNEENEVITILTPLKLLWEPYDVYLEDQKIIDNSYIKNDTHVWISIKPSTSGEITIIGTTAVPEFSLFLPLILGISMIVLLQYKNKITLR